MNLKNNNPVKPILSESIPLLREELTDKVRNIVSWMLAESMYYLTWK